MVAGGYLVLDPQYRAFVTALSCRMHARIQILSSRSTAYDRSCICVSSPQFGGNWSFTIEKDMNIRETTGSENRFLEATVRAVLGYTRPAVTFSYQITLFSDPGYHAQEHTTEIHSKSGLKSFLYHDKPIECVPKTGMGLSAGFVTVVTAALLTTIVDRPLGEIRDVIHKVAQIAHCEAQGKIGSGFDVATAVYGSIVYRRFKPEVIDLLLGCEMSQNYSAEIKAVVERNWDFVISPCSLPVGIKLLMGDVKSGSETPKLVSKVLAWSKANPQSELVFSELNHANESLMRELVALREKFKADPDTYMLSMSQSDSLFEPLSRALQSIRKGLQRLTSQSGADIEPLEQTCLLDSCSRLPGCLGGVVPGAGGYDAVCIFVKADQVDALKKESASSMAFDGVTWLDLSEEVEGLLEEPGANYDGLQ